MYRNRTTIRKLIGDGEIGIVPYETRFQGPNLYYCHLGTKVLIPRNGMLADTRQLTSELYESMTIVDYYDLLPGAFILAELYEQLMTSNRFAIRLFNSSSLARLGVVQCAVGMVNPGCGINGRHRITLELTNTGPFTVRLYPTIKHRDGTVDWGTEVLKVGIIDHEETDVAYSEWSGSLYGSDETVSGSKIDRRETHDT